MDRHQFSHFSKDLVRLGAAGVGKPEFQLGSDDKYELQYIPFEFVNRAAKLVIVGITPGPTQLDLAYTKAQELLIAGRPEEEILVEVKKVGAFGGPSMKPNLLKILRHFQFAKLLSIGDIESLWGENASLLHSTSVVPHAAFVAGKPFAGSFDDLMSSPLMKECLLDCFVPSAQEMREDAMFVGLGPCPQAALAWCVEHGHLRKRQVLGAFCHPSSAGGSTTSYYLREIGKEDLNPKDPVRGRCEWLDAAYEQMRAATAMLLAEATGIPTTMHPAGRPSTPVVAPSVKSRVVGRSVKPVRGAAASSPDDEIDAIRKEFERSSYEPMNETKKLIEYKAAGDQPIYLVKTTSRLNKICLMVHPKIDRTTLDKLDGVEAVSDEFRYHSNMTNFPKRLHKGETETAYGWQVTVGTLASLARFLSAFRAFSV